MSGKFFLQKQKTIWYKILPPKWLGWPNYHHEKARLQHCDVMCHNKIISVQFWYYLTTNTCNNNNNNKLFIFLWWTCDLQRWFSKDHQLLSNHFILFVFTSSNKIYFCEKPSHKKFPSYVLKIGGSQQK